LGKEWQIGGGVSVKGGAAAVFPAIVCEQVVAAFPVEEWSKI